MRLGTPPNFRRHEERLIFDFVTEYFATSRVSQATYEKAIAAFGETGVVDLVGTVGYYTLVSMTLNVFEIALPEGVEEPLT